MFVKENSDRKKKVSKLAIMNQVKLQILPISIKFETFKTVYSPQPPLLYGATSHKEEALECLIKLYCNVRKAVKRILGVTWEIFVTQSSKLTLYSICVYLINYCI